MTMANGVSRISQPIAVTPRCLFCIAVTPCAPLRNRRADAAPDRAAGAARVPIEPDPGGLADQVLLRHVAPGAPVVAVIAVVTHHQIMPRRHIADKRRRAHPARGVLVAAYVAAQAAALARGQERCAVERHRAEDRLVLMGAELLARQRQVDVAAVVEALRPNIELHRLAVD